MIYCATAALAVQHTKSPWLSPIHVHPPNPRSIPTAIHMLYSSCVPRRRPQARPEIAPLVRRIVEIEPDAMYPELGLRSYGKGTFHKPAIMGSELGGKRIYRIEAGDVVFSNVFSWEGAVAVARPEDHRTLWLASLHQPGAG